MTYSLGATSLAHLQGVHPDLVRVVNRAITTTTQDFTVMEGCRTVAEEAKHVADGTSHTMHSRHIGGFAVDLVPWINGAAVWDWPAIYHIAAAMRGAAMVENVPIRWGGCWDRRLAELPGDAAGIEMAETAYRQRHPGPDFLDGPHYELPMGEYP